jgi:hypothetical protein
MQITFKIRRIPRQSMLKESSGALDQIISKISFSSACLGQPAPHKTLRENGGMAGPTIHIFAKPAVAITGVNGSAATQIGLLGKSEW